MNRLIVVGIVVLVILAGGGALLVAKNHNASSNNASNMSMSSNSNNPPTNNTNSVTIQNFAFSPSDITIKKGTAVTWTNQDSVTHTVTENDGQTGPNSGNLDPGKSYSFTFNTTGTFKYHCSIHPEMLGIVTVTE